MVSNPTVSNNPNTATTSGTSIPRLTTTVTLMRMPIPLAFRRPAPQGVTDALAPNTQNGTTSTSILAYRPNTSLPWGQSQALDAYILRQNGWDNDSISYYQSLPAVQARYKASQINANVAQTLALEAMGVARQSGQLYLLPPVSTVFPGARRHLPINVLRQEVTDTLAFSQQLYAWRLRSLRERISADLEAGNHRPAVYRGWITEFRAAVRADARALCAQFGPERPSQRFQTSTPEGTITTTRSRTRSLRSRRNNTPPWVRGGYSPSASSWESRNRVPLLHLPIPSEFTEFASLTPAQLRGLTGQTRSNYLAYLEYNRSFHQQHNLMNATVNESRSSQRNTVGIGDVYNHVHTTLVGVDTHLSRLLTAVNAGENALETHLENTNAPSTSATTVARFNGIEIKMNQEGNLTYHLSAHANRTQGAQGKRPQRTLLERSGQITMPACPNQRLTSQELTTLVNQAMQGTTLSYANARNAIESLIQHKSSLKLAMVMTMDYEERQQLQQQLEQAEQHHVRIWNRYRTSNPMPSNETFEAIRDPIKRLRARFSANYQRLYLAPNTQKVAYLRNILTIPAIRDHSTNHGMFWNSVKTLMAGALQDCNPVLLSDRRYMNEALGHLTPWISRAEGQVRMQSNMSQLNQAELEADGEDE